MRLTQCLRSFHFFRILYWPYYMRLALVLTCFNKCVDVVTGSLFQLSYASTLDENIIIPALKQQFLKCTNLKVASYFGNVVCKHTN